MERYRVKPGSRANLGKRDPADRSAFSGGRKKAETQQQKLDEELRALQEVFYAQRKHKMLLVLQAMDTGGKDGVIRQVFDEFNPQGVRVASFKGPSTKERNHDYLWRIHQQTPENGEVVIFNRSHYEDVLIVRVRNFAPKAVWSRRYDHINDFERMLADEGTVILKFFLHIDSDEQKARLQARIDDPAKHWKLSPSDLEERKLWPDYMAAYEDAISKTSTKCAPWYVIPANTKWYRNLVIASIMVDAFQKLDLKYPESQVDVSKLVVE